MEGEIHGARDSRGTVSFAPAVVAGFREAFRWLSACELGGWPEWNGPADPFLLRERVTALLCLWDLIPRSEADRIELVTEALRRQFSPAEMIPLVELRGVARHALGLPESLQNRSGAPSEVWEKCQRLTDLGRSIPAGLNPAFREQCQAGLTIWFNQLNEGRRWNYLSPLIPGDAELPLSEVYVDLFTIPDEDLTDTESERGIRESRHFRSFAPASHAVVSASTMLARTLERCIVVGEPGSGKSTLVQWLAWSVHRGEIPDFDAPLVIKLSAYARALEEEPELTILEFFFQSLGTRINDWGGAAEWLRRTAERHRRFLVLLDGWDEVPISQRELVRVRMEEVEERFVTVLTSRPSGLPRQLRPGRRVDYYRIAGLSARGRRELVTNLLQVEGRDDLTEEILQRLEITPDLQEMSSNPFLLGLLVRVLVHTAQRSAAPRTKGEVYQQVLAWITAQVTQRNPRALPLRQSQFVGLRQLSHDLLFAEESPRYLFREGELRDRLPDGGEEGILQSRLINRVHLLLDEYGFLHATIQEYFAAEHAATFSEEQLQAFLDRTFRSTSRFIVLEFLAGLGGRLSTCTQQRIAVWLKRSDRFLQIILRVCRILACGRWRDGRTLEFERQVREVLWQEILADRDLRLTLAAVRALAELDPRDLCRRARQASQLPSYALNCFLETIPVSILREEGIDQLLGGAWQDYAGFEMRGGGTPEELRELREKLQDRSLTHEDLQEAVIHAGAAHDHESIPILESYLQASTLPTLRYHLIGSLGTIAGPQANSILLRLVLGEVPATPDERRQAITALKPIPGARGGLDPAGRDRLLRRLTVLDPHDPNVEAILEALQGFPIREGGELIVRYALDPGQSVEVRNSALAVLETVQDEHLIQQVLATIFTPEAASVRMSLLKLATARGIPVSLPWLEEQICHCRQRIALHQLLKAFVRLWPLADGPEQDRGTDFLHHLILRSFGKYTGNAEDLSKGLLIALDLAGQYRIPCLSQKSVDVALTTLARYIEDPRSVREGDLLLAAAILRLARRAAAVPILRTALRMAINEPWSTSEGGGKEKRIAGALANSLRDIAPEELLRFPPDCEIVRDALRSLALDRGWLIYERQMFDSEGVEIASSGPLLSLRPSGMETIPVLEEWLNKQSPQTQNSVRSYLLLVGPDGACRIDTPLDKMYESLVWHVETEAKTPLAENLQKLFTEMPLPTFDSWRTYLGRVAKLGKEDLRIAAFLRQHGLVPRRNQGRRRGGSSAD